MEWWVKIHRKLLDRWRYSDGNTSRVFIHLLLTANHKESVFLGHTIKIWDSVIGLLSLSERLGMSIRSIRTALKHLKTTNEIAIKTTNKFSVITLLRWAEYQSDENVITSKTTSKTTNKWQTNDKQVTTLEECKNVRMKEININIPFTTFRELYNKKIWDKNKCLKKREKLTDEEREKIISVLPQRIKQFTEKQFQPYPETFLNQGRWNDELNTKLNSSFRLL
jgi:hypothetical protein